MGYIYHATQPTRLEGILGTGLTDRAPSKFGGNPGQRGISTTTDFSVVSGGDFGNLVLVLDPRELRDYELVPTDYWGDGREKEVRIVGPASGPTIVPSRAIKQLIFITPRLPPFRSQIHPATRNSSGNILARRDETANRKSKGSKRRHGTFARIHQGDDG